MFIAASCVIAKSWNPSICPSTEELKVKIVNEHYSALEKNVITKFKNKMAGLRMYNIR